MSDKGTIYFLREDRDGGKIKIGFTTNLEERIKRHQTSNPYKLDLLVSFRGEKSLEKSLHKQFTVDKINSGGGDEWFEPSEEIFLYIRSVYINSIKRQRKIIENSLNFIDDHQQKIRELTPNHPYNNIRHEFINSEREVYSGRGRYEKDNYIYDGNFLKGKLFGIGHYHNTDYTTDLGDLEDGGVWKDVEEVCGNFSKGKLNYEGYMIRDRKIKLGFFCDDQLCFFGVKITYGDHETSITDYNTEGLLDHTKTVECGFFLEDDLIDGLIYFFEEGKLKKLDQVNQFEINKKIFKENGY